MEQPLNTNSDLNSSHAIMQQSLNTTFLNQHSNLVSTRWVTGAKRNTREFSPTDQCQNLKRTIRYLMRLTSPTLLTGLPQVLSKQSKIKVNAVHAGPFHLPQHWKVHTKSHLEPCFLSLNNNLLIAQLQTTVAMVVGNIKPSTTTKPMLLNLRAPTHTKLLPQPVNTTQHQQPELRQLATLTLQPTT